MFFHEQVEVLPFLLLAPADIVADLPFLQEVSFPTPHPPHAHTHTHTHTHTNTNKHVCVCVYVCVSHTHTRTRTRTRTRTHTCGGAAVAAPADIVADLPFLQEVSFLTPYRGTSLIRITHPPRITIGPWAQAYCRVLRGGCFL